MHSTPSPIDLRTERWISFRRERPAARLRLFCLPHAGGGASAYKGWPELLPAEVDVCPVQPPGRENRIMEAPLASMATLVGALEAALAPLLDLPFVLFGYSMGATVAYELAQRLRRTQGVEPEMLAVAALGAPHVERLVPPLFDLPDEDFKRRLNELAGTPQEILDSEEMMELLMPLLRADFEIHDTYRPPSHEPLTCPVIAFGGHDDATVPEDHLRAWSAVTSGAFEAQVMPGDHFSLLRDDQLPDRLTRALRSTSP